MPSQYRWAGTGRVSVGNSLPVTTLVQVLQGGNSAEGNALLQSKASSYCQIVGLSALRMSAMPHLDMMWYSTNW